MPKLVHRCSWDDERDMDVFDWIRVAAIAIFFGTVLGYLVCLAFFCPLVPPTFNQDADDDSNQPPRGDLGHWRDSHYATRDGQRQGNNHAGQTLGR